MSIADFSEVFELAEDLTNAGHDIAHEVASGVTKARNNLRSYAEANAPVGETGGLKAGFQTEGGGLMQQVVNRTRQAFFQQFGTSRHPPQPVLFDYEARTEEDLERQVFDSLRTLA